MIDNPRIGKDVIESLTLGMYEDCKFIYREYIQNSADQIDKAVAEGLIPAGEDEIHIVINPNKRSIVIEDNATGIPADRVVPILRNIAHSTKKRGENKGFRGIGRLGGLGYCSKLIFETTYAGEEVKSIMTWDADLLKQIINDRDNSEESVDVLARVTDTVTKKEAADKHYFKVTLEDVTSNELLDVDRVKKYLSMVAPIDISSQFIYRSQINKFIKDNGFKVDIYNIYINGEQIYKPYTTHIYKEIPGSKKSIDDILGVGFLMAKDSEGKIIYWGWYSLSHLGGQMERINIARGIRLRKENIQIGDEEICKKFFAPTDQRFSFYYFGEIHATSKYLIPNSRRDYFGENKYLYEFEKCVRYDFMHLKDMCYDASDIRNNLKIINKADELEEKLKDKNDYISKKEHVELMQQLDEYKKKSQKAINQLAKRRAKIEDSDSPLGKIIDKLMPNSDKLHNGLSLTKASQPVEPETIPKIKYRTDSSIYSKYSKTERKLIGRIYGSIANAIPDERQREALIKVIEEDLTR